MIDPCLFYYGTSVYILYTNDSIIVGLDKEEIANIISKIDETVPDIIDEGNIFKFLGIDISSKGNGSIHLSQPHLVNQIMKDLNMNQDIVKTKDTPPSTTILHCHSSSTSHDNSFRYRGIIGRYGYLDTGSCMDISYIIHQCKRFSTKPKQEHTNAVWRIACYLAGTKDKGHILRPNPKRELEVHVDANFCGNWKQEEITNPDTARLRYRYIISYSGWPVVSTPHFHALTSTPHHFATCELKNHNFWNIINFLLLKQYHYHYHKNIDLWEFYVQKQLGKCHIFLCRIYQDCFECSTVSEINVFWRNKSQFK